MHQLVIAVAMASVRAAHWHTAQVTRTKPSQAILDLYKTFYKPNTPTVSCTGTDTTQECHTAVFVICARLAAIKSLAIIGCAPGTEAHTNQSRHQLCGKQMRFVLINFHSSNQCVVQHLWVATNNYYCYYLQLSHAIATWYFFNLIEQSDQSANICHESKWGNVARHWECQLESALTLPHWIKQTMCPEWHLVFCCLLASDWQVCFVT